MADLTLANIETRVANALRIPTSNTTEMAKVDALINAVYREIYSIHDWWWLVKRGVINMAADYTTGTVSVTNNSTTATLSAAPTGQPSFAGRVLIVTGNQDSGAVYRIDTNTAESATLTLDAAYTGTTDTAAGYAIYQDSYSLATDVGKLLNVKRYGYIPSMRAISPDEMHELKAADASTGKPDVYTVLDFATTGDPTTARRLVIHPYPDDLYRLEYHYKRTLNTELATSNKPLLPDEYRELLWYGALARGYPAYLNDLPRGEYFQGLYSSLLQRMTIAQREYGDAAPLVQPRDEYRAFYRGAGRRINPARANLGSYFGRWPINP